MMRLLNSLLFKVENTSFCIRHGWLPCSIWFTGRQRRLRTAARRPRALCKELQRGFSGGQAAVSKQYKRTTATAGTGRKRQQGLYGHRWMGSCGGVWRQSRTVRPQLAQSRTVRPQLALALEDAASPKKRAIDSRQRQEGLGHCVRELQRGNTKGLRPQLAPEGSGVSEEEARVSNA